MGEDRVHWGHYFPPTHGWTVKVVNIHSGNDSVGDLEEVMDDYYFEDEDDNNDDKSVEEEEAEDNDAEMRGVRITRKSRKGGNIHFALHYSWIG